ncbi:MAG: 50S ribosomal protein L29 [Rickettsiales bacterium]|jgi:large subunit ribosomal protein L29|nr:50S ribosomal protein L29 [Rickettsiales bacterium]
MKSAELKGKTVDELTVLLANSKKELFNLRFQKTNGTLSNTSRVSVVKKSVARIKTLINIMSSSNGGSDA